MTEFGEPTSQSASKARSAGAHRTIQDVLDDPKAARRQAVLAAVYDFFPAFNTHSDKTRQPGYRIGQDSGKLDQGPWVASYGFDGRGGMTSCTLVNPRMMVAPSYAKNDSNKWSFNAGPSPGEKGSPAYEFCDKSTLPKVGDTYIVLNKFKDRIFGHVGIVLEVPPSGNGLWVTADGGQGARPEQIAIIVPRWGVMGAGLPEGGNPKGVYPAMKPEADAGPFLGSAYPGDTHASAPLPARHDDVAGMIARMVFKPSQGVAGVSNPRRMDGFVDVDSDKLEFHVDDNPDPEHYAKAKLLKQKVDKVIAAYLAGRTLGGVGT